MSDETTTLEQGQEEVSLIDRIREKNRDNEFAVKFVSESRARREEVVQAEKKAKEERRNIFGDTGLGIVRGPAGAFEEFFDTLSEVDEWSVRNFGSLDLNPFDAPEGTPWHKTFGYVSPSKWRQFEAEGGQIRSPIRTPEEGWRLIKDMIPEPERVPGQLLEPMGQFLTGFFMGGSVLKSGKVLQGAGRWTQFANASAAGAISDSVFFDEQEERLAHLVQSYPALENPVTEWLAGDIDDSTAELKIKAVLEGAAMGALVEPFMIAGRAIVRRIRAKNVAEAVAEHGNKDIKLKELKDEAKDQSKAEAERVGKAVEEGKEEIDIVDPTRPDLDEVTNAAAAAEARANRIRGNARAAAEIPVETREQFLKAVAEGDEDRAGQILQDFNENTYDFDAIENGEDIKAIMLETERMFSDLIKETAGGVQSNAQTIRLANLVNQNPDSVHALFRDVKDDKGIAARFYAASRIMLGSAENVRKKAKAAWAAPNDTRAQAEALQAVQTHVAIQAEVKGAQKEIARALQAMSIVKQDMAEGFREFEMLRRQFAPKGGGKTAWEDYMDDLAHKSQGLADLNARLEWTPWTRAKNIFIEWTINSMLSSIKTHTINFTSNVLNTFFYSFDRTLGGSWQYLTKGDKAALREVKLDWMHKFKSLDEAWNLAKQAFKDGAPVTDQRQRMEFLTRQAIGSDKTDANWFRSVGNKFRSADQQIANDGTWFQKGVNTLGHIVRMPGRLLITGDEFFKAINRNAEIQVLAFRQADEEAVAAGFQYGTAKYERFVETRIKKLTDMDLRDPENINIRTQAIQKARLTTFQEAPRTDFGSAAEHFINSNWAVKLIIAPFFRTPMNIIRQGVLDRSPLGYFVKANREAIQRGGREAAEVKARMLTSVGAFTAFYALTSSGEEGDSGFQIVGKQPFDSAMRVQGINDYSIKIGKNWYQFNRLEPMGMWLGMVADFRTLAKYRQDEEAAFSMGQAAIFSMMNNVTNKTYLKSISDLQAMAEGIASGSEATAKRAIDRFVAGEFGKLIPQLYKGTARALEGDDESFRKEVWDFLDIVRDRSTTFSDELPLRYDILGREQTREAGISALINPFAAVEHSDDPVDQEFFRLGFSVQPMRRTLGAEQIQLTNEEYSRMNRFMEEPLKTHQTLKQIIEGAGYEDLSDPMKVSLIKKVINENRKSARELILADRQVLDRVSQEKVNAAFLISGTEG